jgi:hypothetical protein
MTAFSVATRLWQLFFFGVSMAAILKPTNFEPRLAQRGEFGQHGTLLL